MRRSRRDPLGLVDDRTSDSAGEDLVWYQVAIPRLTVKLLILDHEHERLLLIHSRDPMSGQRCWYPVGGGLEPGENCPAGSRS